MFVESVWFKCLILHLCLQVVFPFIKQCFHDILFKLVEKTKQIFVFIKIGTLFATTSLTNGCLRGHMIFLLLINFLGFDWQPKQMTIGLFKTSKNINQTLAINMMKVLDQYGL